AAAPPGKPGKPVPIKLVLPRATFEQSGLPVAAVIDGDAKSAWAVDPQFGKDHAAAFDCAAPLTSDSGFVVTFVLKFENNTGHNIGRVRLSATATQALPDLRISGTPERA